MLTKVVIRLVSLLSLKNHLYIGHFLGILLFLFNNRNRHITQVNIDLCFPALSTHEKKRLLKYSLTENGKTLIECFWLWRHPQQVLNNLLAHIENKHLLDAARDKNLGTIFVTPHFGSWEFIGLLTAANSNLLILYTPPKSDYVNQLSQQGRESTGGKVISTDELNVKTMIKHIKSGGCIGILPDQVPEGNGGVYSRFFNRKCYTSTLVCKLANKLKCPVVFCYALRKQQQQIKYNAYYHVAPQEIFDDNIDHATRALNQTIEGFINTSPEQYLWGYKRFKRPAPGDTYPY